MPPEIKKREALLNQIHMRGTQVRVSEKSDSNPNTLSFVFISDDNAGVRFDWGSGEYYNEILDVNGASVARLNTFFKDHTSSVDNAIGKVDNVSVKDGLLTGDVTFGSDDDSQRVLSKYKEGILRDVSIGYEIRDYKVEKGADNERDNVTVTDFDIFEVSAVGIGFDIGAKKRIKNEGEPIMNEELKARLAELEKMAKRTNDEKTELQKLKAQRNEDEKIETQRNLEIANAENAELKRTAGIAILSATHADVVSDALRTKFEKEGSIEDFKSVILEARSKKTLPLNQREVVEDSRKEMVEAMVDGLALRVGAKLDNPHKDAEKYRNASLIQLANEMLPEDKRSFVPMEVAQRSLLSGQFPLLMQSVGSRILVSEFEKTAGTFKAWITEVDVPDFRVMSELTATKGGGRLDKTLENGDLKELSGTEAAEQWKIETFGNQFVLTREMIINDDLGNFTNLLATFGEMAMVTANGIAYDLLQGKGDYSSYKMADGSGLFIAARNNSATDVLSSAALSAGRLAMAKHLSQDGKTPLNITPKYLVIPPALEVEAREILGASQKLGADNVAVPNVNQNLYELIVDPEITSDTAWYLLAERRTLKIGYLAGTNRSPSTNINDTSISRTKFEGIFDIGVMAEDFKGLYRGNV